MTQLRDRMLEELERRNYSPGTAKAYLFAVKQFADPLQLHPDRLAHACSRTPCPSASSSPTSTRSHAAALITPNSAFPAPGPSKRLCACHKTSTPQPTTNPA
jgi:cytoskeletal protein RodZ